MSEDSNLEAIKKKMSVKQRKEMAEIVGNELKRRQNNRMKNNKVVGKKLTKKTGVASSALSGALSSEEVQELYGDVNEAVQQLRIKKLEQELIDARRRHIKLGRTGRIGTGKQLMQIFKERIKTLPEQKVVFFALLVIFGAGSVITKLQDVDAETLGKRKSISASLKMNSRPLNEQYDMNSTRNQKQGSMMVQEVKGTTAETTLLKKLDNRRVELEQRKEKLDSWENTLKAQAKILAEKLAELRSVSDRLKAQRVEKDQRYEARMEQLATVYGSMAPNEAAPLIAQLDDDIALSLLARLPGKRMGQVLSTMPKTRAIELTRRLTDRDQVQ